MNGSKFRIINNKFRLEKLTDIGIKNKAIWEKCIKEEEEKKLSECEIGRKLLRKSTKEIKHSQSKSSSIVVKMPNRRLTYNPSSKKSK